jgi:translation initiation factor IF-3
MSKQQSISQHGVHFSGHDVQVRLILEGRNSTTVKQPPAASAAAAAADVDNSSSSKPAKTGATTSQLVSLAQAIETAVELDKDLVEVDIRNQVIPVVKIISLASLEYIASKQKKPPTNVDSPKTSTTSSLAVSANENTSTPPPPPRQQHRQQQQQKEKELRFSAGIAQNDLMRKIDLMVDFLQQGHRCRIQIRAPRHLLAQQPAIIVDMIQFVLDTLRESMGGTEAALMHRPPQFNPEQTQVTFLVQPPSKKS